MSLSKHYLGALIKEIDGNNTHAAKTAGYNAEMTVGSEAPLEYFGEASAILHRYIGNTTKESGSKAIAGSDQAVADYERVGDEILGIGMDLGQALGRLASVVEDLKAIDGRLDNSLNSLVGIAGAWDGPTSSIFGRLTGRNIVISNVPAIVENIEEYQREL